MKTKGSIIAGLDVGSTKIRMMVGQRSHGDAFSVKLNILGAIEVASQGIQHGMITSMEDVVASMGKCFEEMEKTLGTAVERVWVGISGSHITCQESRGVVAIARSDGEIHEDDVERAIEAARTVATPTNHEILHVIPKTFTIDGQHHIKDPVGMMGIRLEVDALIIQGLTSQMKNLSKCLYRNGVEIEDVVLSVLAASQAILNTKQREVGVAVVDLGATTTSLIVFEGGDVIYTSSLPLGADHITSDIAIGLRISLEAAEMIKLRYGSAFSKDIDKKEMIEIADTDVMEPVEIPRRYITEIISARAEEILEKIDKELIKISRNGMLPAGVVFLGGGAKLPHFIELAKKKLRLPASLGGAQNIISSVDKTQDLSYLNALGLVMWGDQISRQRGGDGFSLKNLTSIFHFGQRMKKWLRTLAP